jgi:hypothetical protein
LKFETAPNLCRSEEQVNLAKRIHLTYRFRSKVNKTPSARDPLALNSIT